MKCENICGEEFETNYDDRYKCVDFELVKVDLDEEDDEGHYEIHLDATKSNGKFINLLRLHIKDAIAIKSIIDKLVYDAMIDKIEKKK